MKSGFRSATVMKLLFAQKLMENVNCAEACVNGCVLGDRCPHREYARTATQFIDTTPLDRLHEISAERFLPKDDEGAIEGLDASPEPDETVRH